MRVNIQPQWRQLAAWYWKEFYQDERTNLSIWGLLERDYGAKKAFNLTHIIREDHGMWVVFPNEKSYTAFLLKWS